MAGYRHTTGDDFDNEGGFLSQPGKYHLIVQEFSSPAKKADGNYIDNTAFGIVAVVAAPDEQKDKKISVTFFEPKPGDQGKFARKKIDRFLIAMNVITEEETKRNVEFDESDIVGRQFCCEFEVNKYTNKKGNEVEGLELKFAEIYHVDDPKLPKDYVKNNQLIGLLPPNQRKDGKPMPSGPTSSADDLDL